MIFSAFTPATAAALLEQLAPRFFAWFQNSEGVAKLHSKHVAADQTVHMMQGTPFASAPDELKRDFARGPAGAAVARFMRLEQQYIGDWKIGRIVEAAGAGFDRAAAREELRQYLEASPVVLFSFVDCPWCLLAKDRLREECTDDAAVRVIELEPLGREGKRLRASIALATGRTSMPAIFVGGRAIGGYTDGDPVGDDADLCLAGSPGLKALADSGKLQELVAEVGVKYQS